MNRDLADSASHRRMTVAFYRVWASEIARVIAGQTATILLPWFILHMVPNPAWYGEALMLYTLPRAVGTWATGRLTVRWSALRVLTASAGLSALALAFLAVLLGWHGAPLVTVVIGAALLSFAEGLYFPAIGTAVPQVVAKGQWSLANTILQGTYQLGRVVVAGGVTALWVFVPEWGWLVVAAAVMAVAALLPPGWRVRRHQADESAAHGTAPVRLPWRDARWVVLAVLTTGVTLGYMGPTVVGLPLFVRTVLHASGAIYARLIMAEALGAVLAIGVLFLHSHQRIPLVLLLASMGVGGALWGTLAIVPNVWWAFGAMGLSMACFTWANVQSLSIIQHWFSGQQLGPVMSTLWMVTTVGGPVSIGLAGVALAVFPVAVLFWGGAAVILLCLGVVGVWWAFHPTALGDRVTGVAQGKADKYILVRYNLCRYNRRR